ncbi:dephospho-CoA kinase [Aquimarina pacifica]|uniref:dephospho-CoA kinase n=1 Tax=Aquimarina pacifica TaxID=1296415 RepID=UPI0004712009|nr:dephospho-CoA kinase [Aquimarina pacifica]
MKVVGITGGIGSGKSTVAQMFKKLGIPIYIADDEAKKMMNTNETIKKEIISLFGKEAYVDGVLNRSYISKIVFSNKLLLSKLNKIVHPAVAKHFDDWKDKQKSPYVIKEAAILFENGGYKRCDYTILVSAPLEIRIQRVLKRDMVTVEQIQSRIDNQWTDAQKIPLADFVINNIDLSKTELKVCEINKKILN